MPPTRKTKRATSHRALRCTYSEEGRRCIKDGEGNPPLCLAHQIAVAEVLSRKAGPRSPVQRVSDLVSDFLAGKRINQEELLGVAQDVAQQWSGGVGGQYRPPIDPRGRTDHQQRTRADDAWWSPRPGQGSAQSARQDQDPDHEQRRVARLRARKVLGFDAKQTLTADEVKQRKRDLAKRNHPDQGGSTTRMATINDAADVLLADPDIR